MFLYFPSNYVWSLTVNIALLMGGQIGEIDRICRPLLDVSGQGDDAGTGQFFESWVTMAERVIGYAESDDLAGHRLTASAKYGRASVYFLLAERMQSRTFGRRQEAFDKGLAAFKKSIELGDELCEFVEIPYGGASYPGLFVPASGVDGSAPCMVFCNGLDSLKEMGYRSGFGYELARRGVSTLFIDQPGTGEAIRLRQQIGYHDSERWASPAYDYLASRDDVDQARIGIMGWSLGGYYAPRAAAFEPRFSICASWGANYDWGELQKKRLAREGDRPVPHYWEHVQWVFGKRDLDEFMAWAPKMKLDGVMDRLRIPYLLTHGERDTQIPFEDAEKQYRAAVNSPKVDLKIFTAEEGGASHASADSPTIGAHFIADWVSDNI
jgi:dienelactone hydrolase